MQSARVHDTSLAPITHYDTKGLPNGRGDTLRPDHSFDGLAEVWRTAPANLDQNGKLAICGHPVMQDWEMPLMEAGARVACKNGGRVLELGFGLGISAGHIQLQPGVTDHVIIEANADIFERARQFARTARVRTTPLFGFWEEVTAALGDESFDGIFFDTYPLRREDVHGNHFPFFKEAMRLLKPGGVFSYYSDEVDGFTPEHLAMLHDAGFTDIKGDVCEIPTPTECEYWKARTMLVPEVRKDLVVNVPLPSGLDLAGCETFGLHLMVDAYGAPKHVLDDKDGLERFLNELPAKVGMERIQPPQMCQFRGTAIDGVTGVVQIVTSHASAHTFSDRGYVSFDLYSCKAFDVATVARLLKAHFGFTHCETYVVQRGVRYPAHNLGAGV